MTYLFIGIGNAGEAISDALLDYKAVRRLKPIVLKPGPERAKEGTIEATLAEIKDVEVAFLISDLSTDTSSPFIAELLAGRAITIILVGILPASRREKSVNLKNVYYSMEKLKEHATSFILVDNQRIAHLPNFEDYYPSYNRYIASCIADILLGTSPFGSSPGEAQSPLQIADVVKALSFEDEPGYAAVSRASELTKGLWGYIFPFMRHKPLDLGTLLRVSLEKFSISDAPLGCEKSVSFLQVPEYYIKTRSVDREQVEEFMRSHAKECRLAVYRSKRNIAAITNLFTYKLDQLERLRELRGLAYEGV